MMILITVWVKNVHFGKSGNTEKNNVKCLEAENAVYQAKYEADRKRLADLTRRDNQYYVFKIVMSER